MTKMLFICVLLGAMLISLSVPSMASIPAGWTRVSGQTEAYSGVLDGIDGDVQNSYAWSMDILGNYLYVGTNRNVVGSMIEEMLPPDQAWPTIVPVPTDNLARIYRMQLNTGMWECYYLGEPTQTTPIQDDGYRMMKTYTAPGANPALYVGSMGDYGCKLLAITGDSGGPVTVFHADVPVPLPLGFSIRAIADHNKQLFWASDVLDLVKQRMMPKIWYATDPLKEYQQNPTVAFPSITVPDVWFPKGAEIADMISYNGALYVFFLPHDFTPENMGFWVAKVKLVKGTWVWQLVVGDTSMGAKYPPGLGDFMNGGATSPVLYKGQIYVGTASSTMIQFFVTGRPDLMPVDLMTAGAKIFRFNKQDRWEQVMPPAFLNAGWLNGYANPLNQYMWRFGVQNDKLYVGTFDARTLLEQLGPFVPEYAPLLDQLSNLPNPAGFDLLSTTDGIFWLPESVDGFSDQFNYGARSFASNPKTGDLFLGTANPFFGCQIWRKKK